MNASAQDKTSQEKTHSVHTTLHVFGGMYIDMSSSPVFSQDPAAQCVLLSLLRF